MNSITITCKHCGQKDTYEIMDFEYYERLVATWLCGEMAKVGTPGYDVYNCKELPGITIQVKFSGQSCRARNPNEMRWRFHHRLIKTQPDYVVLFGLSNSGCEVFVMNYESFISHMSHVKTRGDEVRIDSNNSFDSWIYNYHVAHPPEKNLLNRIKAMIADKQMGLYD